MEAKKVIAGLKRIAQFGKHAEHVLKKLEEDGFYDGRAAYVEKDIYVNYMFRIGSFPKVEKVTREHIQGFGDYKIKFDDLKVKKRRHRWSTEKDEIPVKIIGKQKLVWDGEQIIKESLNEKLGAVKLLKKGFSFRHARDRYYNSKTYKVFTQHESEGGKLALQAMADNIAEKLVVYNQYDNDVPYIMKDLRKMIPRWLEEDKVIEKIFQDFKEYGGVQKIMAG